MVEIEITQSKDLNFDREPYIKRGNLKDLLLISRPYFLDQRGSFQESYRISDIKSITGIEFKGVQSSISVMLPNTIKGIHCERQHKILTPLSGVFIFVEVDLRKDSETFKQWTAIMIDANEGRKHSLFVPKGVGNSMCILDSGKESDIAVLNYTVSSNYDSKEVERVVRYDDPELAIPWPIKEPIVSKRDLNGYNLEEYIKTYL